MLEISSSKNPLIKEIKSLSRKKDRWENKLFIMEGIKLIEEAIETGVNIKNILYSDKLLSTKDGENFFNRLNRLGNIIRVTDSVFNEITGTENTQGILGTCYFDEKSINDALDKQNQFLLFLDGVQDPGNMGTIIRSADAFNIDGIIMGEGCVDSYNPKVVRATMGSIFRVPLYFIADNIAALKNLKEKNFKLYATSLEGSVPNYDILYEDNFVIVIGNESNGVSTEILKLSDKHIKIPMTGGAESLNAGVAASIIMYEGMKQRVKNLEF